MSNEFRDFSFNRDGTEYSVHRPSNYHFGEKHEVIFDGAHAVKFDKRSPISSAIETGMGMEEVDRILMDTMLFTVGDELVEASVPVHKTNQFVHSKRAVEKMVEHIGVSTNDHGLPRAKVSKHNYHYNDIDSEGGEFNVRIGYAWSPFKECIRTFTDVMRLVCSNLQEVENPEMSFIIPMMNAWEENIGISNEALRHAFDSKVRPLFAQLPTSRITMFQLTAVLNMLNHVRNSNDIEMKFGAGDHLHNIYSMLNDTYTTMIDRAGGGGVQTSFARILQLPISAFDTYNMLTEINTHCLARPHAKINTLCNEILFNQKKLTAGSESVLDQIEKVAKEHAFDNVDQAFFGTV